MKKLEKWFLKLDTIWIIFGALIALIFASIIDEYFALATPPARF